MVSSGVLFSAKPCEGKSSGRILLLMRTAWIEGASDERHAFVVAESRQHSGFAVAIACPNKAG